MGVVEGNRVLFLVQIVFIGMFYDVIGKDLICCIVNVVLISQGGVGWLWWKVKL